MDMDITDNKSDIVMEVNWIGLFYYSPFPHRQTTRWQQKAMEERKEWDTITHKTITDGSWWRKESAHRRENVLVRRRCILRERLKTGLWWEPSIGEEKKKRVECWGETS